MSVSRPDPQAAADTIRRRDRILLALGRVDISRAAPRHEVVVARTDLDMLVAEVERLTREREQVEALRERVASWVLGGEGEMISVPDVLDELCRILDVVSLEEQP